MHDCIINIVEIDIWNATARVPMHSFAQMFCIFLLLLVSIPCQKKFHYNNNIIFFEPFCSCLCLFTANYKMHFSNKYYECCLNWILLLQTMGLSLSDHFQHFSSSYSSRNALNLYSLKLVLLYFPFVFFGTLNIERIVDE